MAPHLSAASGTSRACPIESVAQIYESGDELVVLVRLSGGLLELRVPCAAIPREKPRHVNGMNPDATPC